MSFRAATAKRAGNCEKGKILADDVSGVQATCVRCIVTPRSTNELNTIIQEASRAGRRVSLRGTHHSMGGHSLAEDSVLIDMKEIRHMRVASSRATVECGPGCTWGDLIAYLNPLGLSPRTMQSYCSFTVGGTLSVNGHGVTTDYTVSESVVFFDLLRADGTTCRCSRDAERPDCKELFRLVLGGYGLFGIMTNICLKIGPNRSVLSQSFPVSVDDFPFVYEGLLMRGKEEVEVKLARVDVTDTSHDIMMYVFTRRVPDEEEQLRLSSGSSTTSSTVGNLDSRPREMTGLNQLLYKWLVPAFNEWRYAIETQRGSALDWSAAVSDKNTLMMETAEPLARLSQPLLLVDDTFILQEYFVPKRMFQAWMQETRQIYRDIHDATTRTKDGLGVGAACGPERVFVTLINTTIRFVYEDEDTFLRYSAAKEGMFAFVLYYRCKRNAASVEKLHHYHKLFSAVTLKLGGAFYLPYLHHYTTDELVQAYPQAADFFKLKEVYDPDGLFDSLWFRHYGLPFVSEEYAARFRQQPISATTTSDSLLGHHHADPRATAAPLATSSSVDDITAALRERVLSVSQSRTNSFRAVMTNPKHRQAFQQLFLERVFDVASTSQLFGHMCRLNWDVRLQDDSAVYSELQASLHRGQTAVSTLTQNFKKVVQVARQKRELTDETVRVINRLGLVGQLRGYLSIGDHGRLVLPLSKQLLALGGPVYVAHDEDGDEGHVEAAVERGSAQRVGKYIRINYRDLCLLEGVPPCSVDLVTMNQGLHHLPPQLLFTFLGEVMRVLRPGGVFITREHDATPDLIPMCDVAHLVYNCVMGVDLRDERREIRAFRPVEEWIEIISATGFVPTQTYEMQVGDPTVDVMLSFRKPGTLQVASIDKGENQHPHGTSAPPPIGRSTPFQEAMKNVPQKVLETGQNLVSLLRGAIQGMEGLVAETVPPSKQTLVTQMLKNFTTPMISALDRLETLSQHVQTVEGLEVDLFPSELFHGYMALQNKKAAGKCSATESLVVEALQSVAAAILGSEEDPSSSAQFEPSSSPPVINNNEPSSPTAVAVARRLEELLLARPDIMLESTYVEGHFPSALKEMACASLPNLEGTDVRSPEAMREWMRTSSQARSKITKISETIVKKVDAKAWQDMQPHIDELIASSSSSATSLPSGRHPLTLEALCPLPADQEASFSASRPWCAILAAYFGSPHVSMTGPMMLAARLYGLNDIVRLYSNAKSARERGNALQHNTSSKNPLPVDLLGADEAARLAQCVANLQPSSRHVVMIGASQLRDITDVEELLAVTYQGKDCTELARRHLLRGTTLKLTGEVNLDSIFNFGLTPLSVYFYGERKIAVTYRSTEGMLPRTVVEPAAAGVHALMAKMHCRGPSAALLAMSRHPDFPMFRMAEWLIVEIVQRFANSMEWSPSYRFPYMATVGVYFQVLKEITSTIRRNRGVRAAYLSKAFALSLVGSSVLAVQFAQMAALSLPFKQALGMRYGIAATTQHVLLRIRAPQHTSACDGSGSNTSGEEAVVDPPAENLFSESMLTDHEEFRVSKLQADNLFILTLPVFRRFTQVLKELAHHKVWGTRVTLITICGLTTAHVKVSATSNGLEELRRQSTLCQVNFVYSLPPVDGSEPDEPRSGGGAVQCVSVTVSVPHLVPFIRDVATATNGITIEQIFDSN